MRSNLNGPVFKGERMKMIVVTVLVFLLAILARPVDLHATNPAVCKRAVVALLDYSRSFHYLAESKAFLQNHVDEIEGGDLWVVRRLDAQSFRDATDLMTVRLPVRSFAIDKNYDLSIKRGRRQIFETFGRLPVAADAARTDIYGGVYGASRIFNSLCPNGKKVLLIFSDMDDTERVKLPDFNMEGVTVRALFVPRGKDPVVYSKRVDSWLRYFQRLGAKVTITDPTETQMIHRLWEEIR